MDVKNVPLKGLSSSDTEEENFTYVLIADLVVVGGYFDFNQAISDGRVSQVNHFKVYSVLFWAFHSHVSIYFKDHNFYVEANQTFSIIRHHTSEWQFMLGVPFES